MWVGLKEEGKPFGLPKAEYVTWFDMQNVINTFYFGSRTFMRKLGLT